MAISLLERRVDPLEVRVPLLFPLGPTTFPPSMETLDEEYWSDGVAIAGRRLRRSHSWSGYTCRLHRPEFRQLRGPEPDAKRPTELKEQEPKQSASNSFSASFSSATSDWASLLEDELEEEELSRRSSMSATASGTSVSATASMRTQLEEWQSQLPTPPPTPNNNNSSLTTFMVQNLARNTSRRRFIETLNELGFEHLYDYVHVPTSFQNGRNQGFAFVNFINEEAAQQFAGRLPPADGTKPRDKLWRIAPADVQGSTANSAAARSGRMARVRNNARRPKLFPQSG